MNSADRATGGSLVLTRDLLWLRTFHERGTVGANPAR